ncbi:MAG: WbqC family protein [Flavipsychrobacter sp.]|nr:WbqC family protein [Flavipsychrobacter sp.]
MPHIISSFLPFPNLNWWAQVAQATEVCFDRAEHFEKMTLRNRYHVAGANGVIQLSIPLVHGRNQRTAMRDVQISHSEKWQQNHWRTITSVYRRAPYFEHYEHSLQDIYKQQYHSLVEFNLGTIEWLKAQIGFTFQVIVADTFIKDYGKEYIDVRNIRSDKTLDPHFPTYYQLFADRNGFAPNLSLLDLLFSEGPYTGIWIKNNLVK